MTVEATHEFALVNHGSHNVLWAAQNMSVEVVSFEFCGSRKRYHSPREQVKEENCAKVVGGCVAITLN